MYVTIERSGVEHPEQKKKKKMSKMEINGSDICEIGVKFTIGVVLCRTYNRSRSLQNLQSFFAELLLSLPG